MTGEPQSCIAFDVGGTSIRAGLFTDHELVAVLETATPNCWTMPESSASEIRDALLQKLQQMAEDLRGTNGVPVMAVAFPGPVSSDGLVHSAPTIWGDRDRTPYPLQDVLTALWPSSQVTILNDVTAAGWHYAQAYRDFLIVTVSSGIGSKLFLNGLPVLGSAGAAGEIGHVTVDPRPDALRCDCGGRGHLAALASGRSGYRRVRTEQAMPPAASLRSTDDIRSYNADLLNRVHAGDAEAVARLAEVASPLGRALALVQAVTDTRVLLIMGGFALAAGEVYRQMVVRAAAAAGIEGRDWNDMIRLATDSHAALHGASYAAARRSG